MAELDVELLISVAAGLGRWVEDRKTGQAVYSKDRDCLACLKDLQRFLRRDKPDTRQAYRLLGPYNLVKTNLVPLINTYPNDQELLYNALKVITYLTMPIVPNSDNEGDQAYHAQQAKSAILASSALTHIVSMVTEPLERMESDSMTEADDMVVQLVLTFIRNLLCIPDAKSGSASAGAHKAKMQEDLLDHFLSHHIMDLLFPLAQRAPDQDDNGCFLLLEIFHKIFNGADPLDLARASAISELTRRNNQTGSDGPGMMRQLMEREAAARGRTLGKPTVINRGQRYGVVFADVRPDGRQLARTYKAGKAGSIAPPGPKKVGQAGPKAITPRVTASMAAKLRQCADGFLEDAYAIMMPAVRSRLGSSTSYDPQKAADTLRYLQLTSFCCSYVRHRQEAAHTRAREAAKQRGEEWQRPKESPFRSLGCSLRSAECKHAIGTWMQQVEEIPKSPNKDWALQDAAFLCLKDLLHAIDCAEETGNEADAASAQSVLRELLYHEETDDAGLLAVGTRQLRSFSHAHQSPAVAGAAVELIHIVIKHLEDLAERNFVVARKTSRRRKKPAKKAADGPEADGGGGAEEAAGSQEAEEATGTPERDRAPMEDLLGEEEEEEEETQEEKALRVKEVELNKKELNKRLLSKLANPAVVHFYVWVLQGYRHNSPHANRAVVCMLARIADPEQLDCEAMLYQLSVLRVFHKILDDRELLADKRYAELAAFCKIFVRRFFAKLIPDLCREDGERPHEEAPEEHEGERAVWESAWRRRRTEVERRVEEEAGSMLFVELLFWKDKAAARDLQGGYNVGGLLDQQYRSDCRDRWNEAVPEKGGNEPPLDPEEVEELRRLWAENRHVKNVFEAVAEGYGGGMTKKEAYKKLLLAGIVSLDFTEEQTMRLELMWEEHQSEGAQAALASCTEALKVFSAHKVAAKLRELGFQVRAKGSGTSGGQQLSDKQIEELRKICEEHGGNAEALSLVMDAAPELSSREDAVRKLSRAGITVVDLTAEQMDEIREAFGRLPEEHRRAAAAKILAEELHHPLRTVSAALKLLGLPGKKPSTWMTAELLETVRRTHGELESAGITAARDMPKRVGEETGLTTKRARLAMEHLGLVQLAPKARKFTPKLVEELQRLHKDLSGTRDPEAYWEALLGGLGGGGVFTRQQVKRQLKKLGLVTPGQAARSRLAELHDEEDETEEEREGGDSLGIPSSRGATKALIALARGEGGERKAATAVEWLRTAAGGILQSWGEKSYMEDHPMEPRNEEHRQLMAHPAFARLVKALCLKHDEDLQMWSFPGENGSMWINSVKEVAEESLQEMLERLAEQPEGEEEGEEGGEDAEESDESEDEDDCEEAEDGEDVRGSVGGAAEAKGVRMADWSDDESGASGDGESEESLEVGGAASRPPGRRRVVVAKPKSGGGDSPLSPLGSDASDGGGGASPESGERPEGKGRSRGRRRLAKRLRAATALESDGDEAGLVSLDDDSDGQEGGGAGRSRGRGGGSRRAEVPLHLKRLRASSAWESDDDGYEQQEGEGSDGAASGHESSGAEESLGGAAGRGPMSRPDVFIAPSGGDGSDAEEKTVEESEDVLAARGAPLLSFGGDGGSPGDPVSQELLPRKRLSGGATDDKENDGNHKAGRGLRKKRLRKREGGDGGEDARTSLALLGMDSDLEEP